MLTFFTLAPSSRWKPPSILFVAASISPSLVPYTSSASARMRAIVRICSFSCTPCCSLPNRTPRPDPALAQIDGMGQPLVVYLRHSPQTKTRKQMWSFCSVTFVNVIGIDWCRGYGFSSCDCPVRCCRRRECEESFRGPGNVLPLVACQCGARIQYQNRRTAESPGGRKTMVKRRCVFRRIRVSLPPSSCEPANRASTRAKTDQGTAGYAHSRRNDSTTTPTYMLSMPPQL